MLNEFQKFILRGNIVDLAIGFTVGAAFSTVARSLVDDIIMPPISALTGNTDFSDKFIVLRQTADGEQITLDYGEFLTNVLTLLIIAFAMFMIIRLVNSFEDRLVKLMGKEKKEKGVDPANKKCPYCFSTIAYKASRCPNCTSQLEKVDKK